MPAIMHELPRKDVLHVRFPAPTLEAFRQLAREKEETLSEITRRLIREELARTGKAVSITIEIV